MSYLSALRLHFAGRFMADVPTINNYAENLAAAAVGGPIKESGFNPLGSCEFRIQGCTVRSAFGNEGEPLPKDAVIGMQIADADDRVPGKIVDFDVDQQDIPAIYGLRLRLVNSNHITLVSGEFESAAASDLWVRCPKWGHSTAGTGAAYQSVISELEWEERLLDRSGQSFAGSRFLYWLYMSARKNRRLSIKFNLDQYRPNCGRIVGTIGPAASREPKHFIRGRQLLARLKENGDPQRDLFHGVAVVDARLNRIRVDLGNTLPTVRNGDLADLGAMHLECLALDQDGRLSGRILLGKVSYLEPGWYERSAAIVDLPISKEQVIAIKASQLVITLPAPDNSAQIAICEPPDGLFLQADPICRRLQPGQQQEIDLLATRYGQPLAHAPILMFFDLTHGADPGLAFKRLVLTNSAGAAKAALRATPRGRPRDFTDSQYYAVKFALAEAMTPTLNYPFKPSDFISVVVWEAFNPEKPRTTWWGTVHVIFRKYDILFPVMRRILDLKNYDAVCHYRSALLRSLSLLESDPNHMPVSRDLAPAKRKAILQWLRHNGKNRKPLIGAPPP